MARITRSDFRLFLFGLFMLLCLSGVVVRLWVLQVMRGQTYAARLGSGSTVTVRIPSVRGEIRDRNGLPLVQNRASYNVNFYLPDMVSGYRQRSGRPPTTMERKIIDQMPKDVEVVDIVKVVNSSVIPRLQELDLAHDYESRRLKRHYDTNLMVPYTYIEDIDFSTIAKFSEHDVGLPGVDIAIAPVRQYVYGSMAAHILGYVGMPKEISKLPDARDFRFYQPDVVGLNQIEKTMDAYLRGKPGVRVLRRNTKNVLEGEVETTPPKQGANVYLTIDARIQYIVENALRHPSIARGAVVIIDPYSGDILAMASVPSFDPNTFIPSISVPDWKGLLGDDAVPLVNRAVSGFPPGSTYKLVTALAGLTKGFPANRKFNCPGGIQYGNHYFRCWISDKHGQHGMLNVSDAMKVSCNSFFYQYGNAAGIDSIVAVGNLLGMGRSYTHLGLTDEKAGILPGKEWLQMQHPNARWTEGYTANTSIGQGWVLASPLQMATAYAMIANGGIAYEPRLIKTVLTQQGTPVLGEDGKPAVPDEPIIRGDLRTVLSEEQIEEVRRGFWKVVNQQGGPGGSGTGSKGKVKGTVVAGKTGTAQASNRGQRENIAWYCAFAPYDKPKYAIAVMIEGGKGGGSVAGPVAAHILEQCLALEQGKLEFAIKPLSPARNARPFAAIEAISFQNTGIVLSNDDESDTVHDAPAERAQLAGASAEPDLKPEADTSVRNRKKPSSNKARRAEPVRRAQPEATPPRKQNFFKRLFGSKPKTQPAATPPPRSGRN